MFDHVTISVSDRDASETFYRTVLRTLGIDPTHVDDHLLEWADLISRRLPARPGRSAAASAGTRSSAGMA